MELDAIEPGQKYVIWVLAGTKGRYDNYEPVVVTVVRKGAKKVRIRLHNGNEQWVYPHLLGAKDW